MKKDVAKYDYPFRIVLFTTGFSGIVEFLSHCKDMCLVGIMECRYLDDNCLEYAKSNKIAHCFYENFVQMEEWTDNLQVDLIITYKVPFLLPDNIFERPHYGAINIHPSLLPQYRGANPWFWIYYHMESESGVTIHKIDRYEDHGDILAQASFPIPIGSPLTLLQKKTEKTAINLLDRIFSDWTNIHPIAQEKLSAKNYQKNCSRSKLLSELITIDGMRLWHILRGFPFLLKELCPELGEHYTIGDFFGMRQQTGIGSVVYSGNKAYFICCDGNIEILGNENNENNEMI